MVQNVAVTRPRFHLAFPVHDLEAARAFYVGVVGCAEGRSDETWVDFDLYGHQIVAHLAPETASVATFNVVDGDNVPVPHFGLLLEIPHWRELADRLASAQTPFVIEPGVRFEGAVGEQHTMFVLDPSGNALEFKAYADDSQIFATG